ncbi:MAG: hypothetical protein ACKVOL_08255 [Novosphingobium sp.]
MRADVTGESLYRGSLMAECAAAQLLALLNPDRTRFVPSAAQAPVAPERNS